ncbi:MAG: M20/M25/M40 family metallo-hydrolase [Desulfobacteraceae bacterium]|nr:M20/M25/M40 family metallo-hydrolase [Desulfobacteraceae bacterium]
MNINSIKAFIEKTWDKSAMPALKDYIAIPAVSPFFAPDWKSSGLLMDTLRLAETWLKNLALENSGIQILSPEDRTPVLLVEIEATGPANKEILLLYGHLDKQPPAQGWDDNKGPWQPVTENNRLYGRGSADDGYAVFAAALAVKALQVHKIPHGRCVILIETCEESGSRDLDYYLEALRDKIGTPTLVVCLDSGCGDYERMWITTSLRGTIVGELEAKILSQSIHSGASGMVASSFRIIRQLMDRIEDSKTGEILVEELHGPIPEKRLAQIQTTAALLGNSLISNLPLVEGAFPTGLDPVDLIIAGTWKPTLSCTGAEGFPPLDKAANVIRESTKLLLSIRTPPGVDTGLAAERVKTLLEKDPPYGAHVTFNVLKQAKGWDMPGTGSELETRISKAALLCFGNTPCFTGEGGSIPFMNLLCETFPEAKFLVTGVLGPQSNAHGPNEFLHLPYVKKLTQALSLIIANP